MKKITCILSVMAAALVGCTAHDDVVAPGTAAGAATDSRVAFATYTGRPQQSRAGITGSIDTERLKLSDAGFGVFAYKTDATPYADYRTQNAQERRYPNFMYNEQITYQTDKWDYATEDNVKYWPNNYEAGGGKVSFFAYAPYVAEATKVTTAAIGGQPVDDTSTSHGIVAFSTPAFNGGTATATDPGERRRYSDPYVTYRLAPGMAQQVDLLWATTEGSSAAIAATAAQTGGRADALAEYDADGAQIKNPDDDTQPTVRPPFYVATDLTKQKTDGTVSLVFKHALAKLGGAYTGTGDGSDEDATTPTHGLMVVLDIDRNGAEFGNSLQPYTGSTTAVEGTPYNTKVTINEIKLEIDRQLTDEGVAALTATPSTFTEEDHTVALSNEGILNLATGVWTGQHAVATTGGGAGTATTPSQTIVPSVDATTDATRDAILATAIAEPQSYSTTAWTQARFEELPVGVTTVAKNVYNGSDAAPFMLIPGACPVITITIDYTVRTFDAKLADNYTEVRQRITRPLYILDQIQLNKQYNILMHLGLTSVKFEATVSDWDITNANGTPSTTPGGDPLPVLTYDGEETEHIYLPSNVK